MNYSALFDQNLCIRPKLRAGRESNSKLLQQMAEHQSTHSRTLSYLAKHPFPPVRIAVSHNPNISPELICVLAQDNNPDVRYAVAENPRVPIEILKTLIDDKNLFVSARALTTMKRIETVLQDKFRAQMIAC
ncbi:MAG TPA: HEAT repeat domain-containing protein [Planktothrix sp.]|jgi:hypothetical protein